MTTFEFFQIVIDIVFLFLILLLVVGRTWKKGQGGSQAQAQERESYREMIETLSVLIKEMKETSADLQERIGEKQLEAARTLAAIEERMEKLRSAVPPEAPAAKSPRRIPEPARRVSREIPPAARPERTADGISPRETRMTEEERKRAEEETERKEKYKQVMELAEKGWSALDIARFTQVPVGEVDLLMRTKVPRK